MICNSTHKRVLSSFKKFKTDVYLVHGNKYDYSKVAFLGNSENIEILCPEHGPFWQRASRHLEGKDCPNCAIIKMSKSKTKTTNMFKQEQIKVHGAKRYETLTEYTGRNDKLDIKCLKCGHIFSQNYKKHIERKQGCSKCNTGGGWGVKAGKEQRPTSIYYLSINDGTHYKVGISCELDKRIKSLSLFGDKIFLIKSWDNIPALIASKVEHTVIKNFSSLKINRKDYFLPSGNSELFTDDIEPYDYVDRLIVEYSNLY